MLLWSYWNFFFCFSFTDARLLIVISYLFYWPGVRSDMQLIFR